jgi:alanine-glyoxylate transaminase/serine-glyoxylate transaminase/serine-pyruvate transaminase
MSNRRLKLMIPGPVEVEDEVLTAMGEPVMPHYGVRWTEIWRETIDLLKMVFKTDGDVFLMVGSGSAGIDACIGSAIPRGEKILVCSNGFFGERMARIAKGYGLDVRRVEVEWGEEITPPVVEKAIQANPDAAAVAMVHLETSTAIANPIEEIGDVVRDSGMLLIVDTVSSLGGLPLEMDDWGIHLCASASQKCLGAPPGLTPVAVHPEAWEKITTNDTPHGWYLDLRVWRRYAREWGDWHPFPTTTATNNVLALRTSLKRLLDEGIETRLARFRRFAKRLRSGLREIGMSPFTSDENMVPVVTPVCSPEGVPAGEVVDFMEQVHAIKIAPGLGEGLGDKIFRIGHMSPSLTDADIDRVLEALADFDVGWRG